MATVEQLLTYRLYFLRADGHVMRAAAFECVDDEAAIEMTQQMTDGSPTELWQQARRVATFSAPSRSAKG
jgi:hypothetical protein